MQRIEDTTELTGSNSYTHFVRTNADCTDRYWGLSSAGMIKTDSASPENAVTPASDWDTDALAGSPSSGRDMTIHGNDSRADSGRNKLFVTTDSGDIAVLNDTGDNTWTASWWITKHSQPALGGNNLTRPIEYFPFRKISLVGDGNMIHTISRPSDTQNDTVTYARLVLPNNLSIRHIFTTTNRAWILCHNKFGGEGAIAEWDGFSQSVNEIHKAGSVGPMTGVNYKEIPIVLNSKGFLLEYNGRGFSPMVRDGQTVAFPTVETLGTTMTTGTDTAAATAIHPRGITVGEDGLVYLNVGFSAVSNPKTSSGIFALNPMSGQLYHKHSLGRWGDSTDYGAQLVSGLGGLYWVPNNVSTRSLLAGGRILTDATTSTNGVWLLEDRTTTTPTRGYFVTQYIQAEDVKESWDIIWARFKRFMSSTNSIIIKARGTRDLSLSNGNILTATITWTSGTTFTVTLAAADDSLQVGDEVEVYGGGNSGYLAHITTISGAHAALQTITNDETVPTTSGTSIARFDRWKKIGTITDANVYEKFLNIGIDSSFIQFKVEMRGPAHEMELAGLVAVSKQSIQLEK